MKSPTVTAPQAVVLAGDIQAWRPLDQEFASILSLKQVRWIPGAILLLVNSGVCLIASSSRRRSGRRRYAEKTEDSLLRLR